MKNTLKTVVLGSAISSALVLGNAFAGPIVDVNPGTTQFGDVLVGTTAGPETIIITNTGDADLVISSITLRGRDFDNYAVAAGTTCPMGGGTLSVGQSCEIKVTFTPNSIGYKKALFKIVSNGDPSPAYAYLRGTGVDPSAELTPSFYDYGHVWIEGPTFPVQQFTLQNTGNTDLIVQGIHLRGQYAPNWQFVSGTDACPYGTTFTLPEGQDCQIYVEFHPIEVGEMKAAIKVYTNDTDEPKLYSKLVGVGRSAYEPDIDLCEFSDPADFGEVPICTGTITHRIELQNEGQMDLNIDQVLLRGRDAANFSIVTDNCSGTTLTAGQICDVYVQLDPAVTGTGYKKAVLKVRSNDPDENPYIIYLRATVTDCSTLNDIIPQ
ncbi:MAG: choice-of-anchor D domain-containing protein [Aquificae bacterium]|nr:choice-of-anchor D domain-containing protein [Aquificota bacterium]